MADKTVVVRIVVRANQFSSGLRGAAADTQKFAVDVERSSAKAGSSALALGAASATAGKLLLVGIGGALVVSAKAAIDFESSLAGVAKTTDLTGSAFAKAGSPLATFGQALRSLSLRIPLNVNELARIAEVGGQLGIQTPNLIEFTEVMAALGVSTNLSAEQAATGLARFVNIMGSSQSRFGELGSVLVDLGNNFATTESEILNFGLRLAPIGKTIGLTESEVFGLAAAMTSLGVPVERGGTALQRLFLDMQAAVLGGGEALNAFASATRLTAGEFVDLFELSPAQAFAELVKQLDETQRAGGSARGALESIGVIQQRSIQVLLAAANGWEVVADGIERADEAIDEGNALQIESARRYGTSVSQIQLLGNAFTDLRIEIGNALLGGGGLAAGLDFLREFVRIIKDNLPRVAALAKVLATVAAIRIGAGMISSIHAGFVALKGMQGAAFGAARGTAALRLGLLGLNTAVFGAIGIAAILITQWAATAAKAAALRTAARELREELEKGGPPTETIVDTLKEQGVFSEEVIDLFGELGVSADSLVERLLAGDKQLEDLMNNEATADVIAMADALGLTTEELQGLYPNIDILRQKIFLFQDSLRTGEGFLEDFFQFRGDEIFVGLREAGQAFGTLEQQRQRAMSAAQSFPLDTSVDEIVHLMTSVYPDAAIRWMAAAGDVEDANEGVGLSWQELVAGMESGADRIDSFWEAIVGSVGDFQGTLAESFEEVQDIIIGGFPVWDEYEQVTLEALDGVIDAQDAYLEDLRAGFALEEELAGTVGANVLNFVQGLDAPTKAALARWRATNEEEFGLWIAQVGGNLDEVEFLFIEAWQRKLPEAMDQGFKTLVATALAAGSELELTGEAAADNFTEGIVEQMRLLPAAHKTEFLGFMEEALEDKGFLDSLGFDLGDDIILGLIRALSGMAARTSAIFLAQAAMMQENVDKVWGRHSPSRWMEELGRDLTRGLVIGLDDEFDKQMLRTSNPIVNILGPKPNMTANVKVQSGSRDINLWYPQHTSDDVISGVKTASVLNSLQREAEVVVGVG